jgi:hypothetical protein
MSFEIRSLFHFSDLRKLSYNDCLTQINEAYGPGMILLSTVRRWYIAFASSKTTLDNDDEFGRPVNAKNSMYVQGILMNKPFVSARYIVEKPEQSRAAILKCFQEELGLRKIKFCWVPHELSAKPKSIKSK